MQATMMGACDTGYERKFSAVGSLRKGGQTRQVRLGVRTGVLEPAILEGSFEGQLSQVTERVSKRNLASGEKHKGMK